MTESISAAVARVQEPSPRALVATYQPEFSAMLPSHIKSESWMRQAAAALRSGKIGRDGKFELETAAQNNPQVFINALRRAASLGLTPGGEEFYLTPRMQKGRLEILGIVGYQGYIELMYRAGAVSSVKVELVYSNDEFSYSPSEDDRPHHVVDWFGADRGKLIGVYAYAVMKDGATSKVVVLNGKQIEAIKAKSQGANSEYSPWQTNPEAMWLKSAVRQLRKWVPTSAEYITTQLRAAKEAELPAPNLPPLHIPDTTDDQHDDVIEAEFVEDSGV